MKKALVFDGYVDEPSCFGVPPYISPYVRYAFGLLQSYGFQVSYITADEWRKTPHENLWKEAEIVTLITGFTVPGRYRGGKPLLLGELEKLLELPRKGLLFFGGSITHGYSIQGGRAAKGMKEFATRGNCFAEDPVASLQVYLEEGRIEPSARKNYKNLTKWAVEGASLVFQHPFYPQVIAELELSEGCGRKGKHCSFCTEWQRTPYRERPVADVLKEIEALAACGIRNFRLGKCSDILAYGGSETPQGKRPNPKTLEKLYRGIRKACPELEVLHTDNCNPLTVARFPEESRKSVEIIASYNTEGDCLSLGIENLDPLVLSLNNLKITFEEALEAVRIINEAGGWRERPRGLPKILPGLNFLLGLPGETGESYKLNAFFLETLLREGLSVRRINIRKVIPFQDSPLPKLLQTNPPRVKSQKTRKWKEWVREEVDPVMFQRFAPLGTVFRNVLTEKRSGKCLFGRPLGSYPPLIGIMDENLQENLKIDVAITDYGKRSLTGVPYPLSLATCSRTNLLALPGIGKARAEQILTKRAAKESSSSLENILDDSLLAAKLSMYFSKEREE
ncbi:MAG TPA: radical SAM protein [Synergistaceae bacterium]|nr:radical SAM protein [Synergistaceae bacterium]HPJ24623.1 radical SAM protein [Synergistaceae bacterium]HPQ36182.1 radical SAM protein [Synergistaceae bacterium]